jgi:hypothetical protein
MLSVKYLTFNINLHTKALKCIANNFIEELAEDIVNQFFLGFFTLALFIFLFLQY